MAPPQAAWTCMHNTCCTFATHGHRAATSLFGVHVLRLAPNVCLLGESKYVTSASASGHQTPDAPRRAEVEMAVPCTLQTFTPWRVAKHHTFSMLAMYPECTACMIALEERSPVALLPCRHVLCLSCFFTRRSCVFRCPAPLLSRSMQATAAWHPVLLMWPGTPMMKAQDSRTAAMLLTATATATGETRMRVAARAPPLHMRKAW